MAKASSRKVTTVHEHSRRVPISKKNPTGVTVVDQHQRRVPGTYLTADEIAKIFKEYDCDGLVYPTSKKLDEYENADKYDEIIAVWTDYFNKKFAVNPPLDPDTVKALIASESGFDPDPPGNKKALGITQITKETLKALQDPKGEAKEFTFEDFRQKDLKNPEVAIPMAIRWLLRKRDLAQGKLKRTPTNDEIILEYKGLLKSKTDWKKSALKSYQKHYDLLKKK
ncbi:transglycosylase SLT domain-containing protein [Bdellovibrio bacteriovorus]|uniref:transglycosylase SLT domain-containing protein n=1 Tax=Bdellovibrio bacteriovorus TaxID=959 RepID=UPI0035A8F864